MSIATECWCETRPAWQHINLHGEYDFSDEKLQDSVGLSVVKNLGLRALENPEDEIAATAAR